MPGGVYWEDCYPGPLQWLVVRSFKTRLITQLRLHSRDVLKHFDFPALGRVMFFHEVIIVYGLNGLTSFFKKVSDVDGVLNSPLPVSGFKGSQPDNNSKPTYGETRQ